MDTNTTATKTPAAPANKKPSSATVDDLIARAKQRSVTLAEKSPEAAKKLNEASEKTKEAEKQRAEARRLRDEARATRKTERDAESAKRAEARKNKKDEVARKRAERDAQRLEKSEQKTKKAQNLSPAAAAALESVKGLSLSELTALHAALGRLSKERSVAEAGTITDKPEAGDTVEVISGDYAGKTGVVTKAQRVRCFVKLDGVTTVSGGAKEAYLYLSQVKVTTPSKPAKTTTEAAA